MSISTGGEVDVRRRSWTESTFVDVAIAIVLAVAVFAVHPVPYMLHHPFWLDEAWVATLTRAPLSRAVALSSSITPFGWLLLLRSMPNDRSEDLRLVPLLFSAISVAAAYVVARNLPWGSKAFARVAGISVGLVVLLAPLSLLRNDLKQYTADAFFSLAILALANRAEGAPGSRTMVELAAGSVVAMFFSTAAAFVVVAVFAGLLCAAVAARSIDRVRTVAIGSAVVAATMLAYFAFVVLPHASPALRPFWDAYYLPSSFGLLSELWDRLVIVAPALGMSVVVAVALFVAGGIVLARLGRPGLASALALLWIEMIVVATARRYPFLDPRTSTFLLVVSLVVIVIGFLGIVRVLASRWRLLVTSVALLVAAAYFLGCIPYIRDRSIPDEDVRSAVGYVARERRPGDVLVVTLPSSYGFSYYWPAGRIEYRDDDAVSTGFVTEVRGLRDVVYVGSLTSRDTTRAMRRAIGIARHDASGSRIWIIRTHLYEAEARAWERTFRDLRLHPRSKQLGPERLWIVS